MDDDNPRAGLTDKENRILDEVSDMPDIYLPTYIYPSLCTYLYI